MSSLKSKTVTIGLPKLAAVILGVIGGVAQVVNYSLVSAGTQLHAVIAAGIFFLIAAGIPPLTGGAFQAVVHLPAWANYLIAAAIGTGLLVLSTISITPLAHEVVASALTVLQALGFSAAVMPVPVAPKGKR